MFYAKPIQKGMNTRVEIKIFIVVREVLHNSYRSHSYVFGLIVLRLILLRNKPKKFDFDHQTVSHWEVCAGWACIALGNNLVCHDI